MKLLKRYFDFGCVYVNTKNNRIAIENNGKIISDKEEVFDFLTEKRIPVSATLEITGRCNFECYYCYAKSLTKNKDLSLDQIKEIIDKIYDAGVVFLDLTGGETLLRKDFIEIVKYINNKGFIVSIFSNGSLFTQEIIDELKKGYLAQINISLLAPNKALFDKLTGRIGNFDKLLNGINLLKQNEIKFILASSITNENICLYDEFNEFKEKHDVKIRFAYDVGPTFEGYDQVKNYAIKDEQVENLKKFFGGNIESIKNGRRKYKCSAAQVNFAITSEGNILPCMKLRKEIGNILEEDFNEIWNSSKMMEIINKTIKRNDKCGKCKKYDYCFYCPGEIEMFSDIEQKCRSTELFSRIDAC